MTDTIELSHWINGEKVPTDRPSESLNPSDTRDLVARTPDGGVDEVNAAVAAAKAAFPAWSEASPEVRSDILDKAGTLVMERREQLGRLLSREEGKTLPEGIGETVRAAVRGAGHQIAGVRRVQAFRGPVGRDLLAVDPVGQFDRVGHGRSSTVTRAARARRP